MSRYFDDISIAADAIHLEARKSGIDMARTTARRMAAVAMEVFRREIPEPEEPNRWRWDRRKEVWEAGAAIGLLHDGIINEREVLVTGTAADRDAKRDALLEAARKAGKP